ncbi:MAG: UBA/ThiF-type NAD/FAD binding protein [uncultured bacterium]|nr:MAG: UBA/ThiF-type NAD/FAD binding protein [uncultured bacterium]
MNEHTEKFLRTKLLLGKDAIKRLNTSKVMIFGMGAVGSYGVEALARSGIGTFKLVDFDVIRFSNFNRQLFALDENLNKPKVELARQRILSINPKCNVNVINDFAADERLDLLVDKDYDVLLDAIDSVGPKTDLLTNAFNKGIKIVSSMGAGNKFNPALIRSGDISETEVCPLARLIRRRLRRNGIKEGIKCIYSPEKPFNSDLGTFNEEEKEDEQYKRGRKRNPIGTISTITGMFGLLAAHEILKLLLKDIQLSDSVQYNKKANMIIRTN